MKKISFLFALIILLFGCSQMTTKNYHGTDKPKEKDSSLIEVLTSEPERPYEVIGDIDGRGAYFSSDEMMIQTVKNAAGEMGADAVIIGYKTKKDYDWGPMGGAYAQRKATAIRWTAPEGAKRAKTPSSKPSPSTTSDGLPNPQPIH
jgi:hypothetical protein